MGFEPTILALGEPRLTIGPHELEILNCFEKHNTFTYKNSSSFSSSTSMFLIFFISSTKYGKDLLSLL